MTKAKTTKPRAASAEDEQIGQRIRARRVLAGISQTELGDALGVSFQQIQKYEKGVNRVSVTRLTQIADALQESVMYFMPPRSAKGDCQVTMSKQANAMVEHMTDPWTQRLVRSFAELPDDVKIATVRLVEKMAGSGAED